jgi:hypothetical protein
VFQLNYSYCKFFSLFRVFCMLLPFICARSYNVILSDTEYIILSPLECNFMWILSQMMPPKQGTTCPLEKQIQNWKAQLSVVIIRVTFCFFHVLSMYKAGQQSDRSLKNINKNYLENSLLLTEFIRIIKKFIINVQCTTLNTMIYRSTGRLTSLNMSVPFNTREYFYWLLGHLYFHAQNIIVGGIYVVSAGSLMFTCHPHFINYS